jgi:guanine deaminase
VRNEEILIVKGTIIFTPEPKEFEVHNDSFLVICNGVIEGIYQHLPGKYAGCSIRDYGRSLIIPGFVDLHTHASQFMQRGLGMDLELLAWLNQYTFREEEKFADTGYAAMVYEAFAEELIKQGTTRVVCFATIHKDSSNLLFEILSRKGLAAYVGKVNMDINCPGSLKEDTRLSLKDTEELLKQRSGASLVKPIVTPRFAPTSTKELLAGLGRLAAKYDVPIQSHLSENLGEIEWVAKLFPEHEEYYQVYNHFGLFGHRPTLMAHCIHLSRAAMECMARKQVIAVHCPDSNMNLASGIMPVRLLLDESVQVGLGSDVGAGQTLAIPQIMVKVIQLSKINYTVSRQYNPLTLPEVFYMGTKGGGQFFGKVGSFEKGYAFDALVIKDDIAVQEGFSPVERLQRFIYAGDAVDIVDRYIAGREIPQVRIR